MDNSNQLILKEDNAPMTPGYGVAGQVQCPLKQFPQPCVKQACEWWVELNYGDRKVARCAVAWAPVVAVELRQEIEKLRKTIEPAPFVEVKEDGKT